MGFDLHGENPIIKEGTVRPEEIDWDTATDKEKKNTGIYKENLEMLTQVNTFVQTFGFGDQYGILYVKYVQIY